MPGFTGIDDIIRKITVDDQSTTIAWYKRLFWSSGDANATWFSTWYSTGFPDAGATPGSAGFGTTYVNTAGGIVLPNRSPATKHLLYYGATSAQSSSIGLYDRLVGVGNIQTLGVGVKPVNTPALPRYTGSDSVGVQAWMEVTTGGGRPTVRMSSYTNQDGVAGRSGPAFQFPDSSSIASSLVGPLPMQSGDTGVRSVEQVTVDATGTSVIVNLILLRWIGTPVWSLTTTYNDRDHTLQGPRLPRIYDGATLVPVMRGTGFSAGIHGLLQVGWA